ncbi:hypothetical protein LTR62_001221 [Meristemomyces frigidus]|uniref:DUF803-domain-containing protein n=1 Tax=Meristemomyces frigidus TaxID=1508187 RepID=A0AAN7TGQ1_9PEZI|nr:hypothetical protein LTR62_001221 [Meristemomyces frigidus]
MDIAQNVLYHTITETVTLLARADPTSSHTSATHTASATSTAAASPKRPESYKIVGICLAVASGLFIGVSFVLKKVGLLKANVKYQEEAGEGYGYLKNAYWWGGMTLMIIGEICNFVAYAFTDAILVTPLGALSVVITTILSAIFLKERLSFVGKIGCAICILGSIIIPLNAPSQSAVADIQEMQRYVITPGFLSYAGVIILGCLFTAFWAGPRYGKKSMLVYLTICSLIGGLSVVSTQGLGSAIVAQVNGEPQFNKWFLYVLFAFVICTLVTEIIYLNKALNLFNASLVTPTYYVYFTSSTIVASAVLFQGLHGTVIQIVDVVLGFMVICSGVVLLQLAKSAKDVPDTEVFKGDLDQIRTVAEVEEPEYEPRADTIRGGAGIVRALSKVRTKRQADEVKRIHDEMNPIGEGDEFEWDGLRRRKTVSSAGRSATGSLSRRKTVHPPLGMSRFPDDHDDTISEPDSEVHPGFFGRIGRIGHHDSVTNNRRSRTGRSPVPLGSVTPAHKMEMGAAEGPPQQEGGEHVYGLPSGLRKVASVDGAAEDTAYKGASASATETPHIRFAGATDQDTRDRAFSHTSSLAPPQPPPHARPAASGASGAGKRQFSFQNPFQRKSVAPIDDDDRPTSRGALSFSSRASARGGHEYPTGSATTEEERAGLVRGDSSLAVLPGYSEVPEDEEESGVGRRRSDEWQPESGGFLGGAEGDLGGRRGGGDLYGDFDGDEELGEPLRSPVTRDEYGGRGSGRSGGAFV